MTQADLFEPLEFVVEHKGEQMSFRFAFRSRIEPRRADCSECSDNCASRGRCNQQNISDGRQGGESYLTAVVSEPRNCTVKETSQ